MTITWQDAATAGILLTATVYVARCLVRFIRRKGVPTCGCCTKCPAETAEKPLIHLDERPRE